MPHDQSHDHAHDHAGWRLGVAALITGAFMLAEVVGGIVSGSLALLADAGHMLTDFASLAMAWYGVRLARRPADSRRTYGWDRFTVLVAFANGLALFAVAGWIVWEAVGRLLAPGEVLAGLMLGVAVLGLVVNLAAFWVLHGGADDNLNTRAALLHVLGDLLGSVAAIVAAGVIWATGWTAVDPILSALVACLILRAAWRVTSEAGHILLEGAPAGVDPAEIVADLEAMAEVEDVHHLHAWSISEARPMVTLHARIGDGADAREACEAIKRRLVDRFGIDHATVEIERHACLDDVIRAAPSGGLGAPA